MVCFSKWRQLSIKTIASLKADFFTAFVKFCQQEVLALSSKRILWWDQRNIWLSGILWQGKMTSLDFDKDGQAVLFYSCLQHFSAFLFILLALICISSLAVVVTCSSVAKRYLCYLLQFANLIISSARQPLQTFRQVIQFQVILLHIFPLLPFLFLAQHYGH